MYSNLEKGTHYFYFTDGEGNAIGCKTAFGVASSSAKKMFHSHLNRLPAEKRRTPEAESIAGRELSDYLFPRGENRKWWREQKPATLKIVRVDVVWRPEGIVEESRIVYERSVPKVRP